MAIVPIQKIFAYNTGSLISGTTQVGDIAVSDASVQYSDNYGGLQWWGGPDETNGYVIAHTDPSGSHDGAAGGSANLGFWRSSGLTDSDFLTLCNSIPPRIGDTPFTNTTDASAWLYSNGYWTSFYSVTPTPTASPVLTTPTPTPSVTPTMYYYSVSGYSCGVSCSLVGSYTVMSPTPLTIGYFYNNPENRGYTFEILSLIPQVGGAYDLTGEPGFAVCIDACNQPSPSPTPTVTNTQTPTVTTTGTLTPTPTPTSAATASFAVSMIESGSDVVLSYSGILDLTGLDYVQDINAGGGGVGPSTGTFGIGPSGTVNVSLYTGATFSYPSSFGAGGGGGQPYGSGNYFGVFNGVLPTNCVVVPSGYTSGNYIQGTTTLSASTFSSLGMNTGTYNYSWGAGAGQSFVLTIGGAGVTPTPTATSVTPTPTPTGASGNFNVTISQVGPDVVWNGSGSFNLSALSSIGSNTIVGGYAANQAIWAIGPSASIDQYSGVTTYPTSFGTGGAGVTSNTGSTFGILPGGSGRLLYVPAGYTSNTTISGSSTYANNTISGMGLTPGTYTWSWGSGGNTSTLVMTISS